MAQTPRLTWLDKNLYGIGAVAYGIKNNGFDYFFLIFYSQVMGVDASLVATSLLLALVFDALSDPAVGYLSDNTRTAWGRRHPYIYAAAVPIAIAYYFMWNPPASLQGYDLFPYIVVVAILTRTLLTLFEVPATALAAELTQDYNERTSLLSFRYFYGWAGGTLMATFVNIVLLAPTADDPQGIFNVAGYGQMGLVASCVMFTVIVITAIGTHRFIPHLKLPPPDQLLSITRAYKEIYETLVTPQFGALFGSAMFAAVASGLTAALHYYLQTFLWGFTTQQIGYISASVVISALMAGLLSPIISSRLGKRNGAIAIGILAFTVQPLMYLLRILGVMPDNDEPILFPLVLGVTVFDVALIIVFQTLFTSMIADLVEDAELKTGRRSEGVFFAGVSFIRKCTQGIGGFMAGVLLMVAAFPKGAKLNDVPPEAIYDLTLTYVPTVIILWGLSIFLIRRYHIDEASHAATVSALQLRREERAD